MVPRGAQWSVRNGSTPCSNDLPCVSATSTIAGSEARTVATSLPCLQAYLSTADEQLKNGNYILPGKRGTLFETFISGFWSFEGEYITRALARGGHFSRRLAEIRAAQLEKWILPFFKGKPLGSFKRHEVESWVMTLYKRSGLTPSTVNRCLTNMKILMAEATRLGFCVADPAAGIEMLAEKRKERGVLLPEEIRQLFAADALQKVWNGERIFFAAAMLAITCGLRAGEIRALRVMDIHSDFVTVAGSWEEGHSRGGAKWGSEHIVPVPARTAEELQALTKENAFQGSGRSGVSGFQARGAGWQACAFRPF